MLVHHLLDSLHLLHLLRIWSMGQLALLHEHLLLMGLNLKTLSLVSYAFSLSVQQFGNHNILRILGSGVLREGENKELRTKMKKNLGF